MGMRICAEEFAMKYDFENVIDRTNLGSSKWNEMRQANPNVPKGIIPFSVADMELKNPPQIMEGLRSFLNADTITLGYTTATGEYNKAVQGWMKRRHSWEVDMSQNVFSPGVVTALYAAVRAFTETGDGVIMFSPVYYPFRMSIEAQSRIAVDVPLLDVDMRYEINWAAFEAAAALPQNKLLLFCSPHNPVSRVWTASELQRLSEICLKNDVLVVSDEIHHDIVMPGYRHIVYATLSEEAAQNSIICTSPSKTFSLAGIQTSNIFIPNEELRKRFKHEMFENALFTTNAIGYKACEIAYTQCGEWLDEVLELIERNAKTAEHFLAENVPEIRVYPLEGTYLQWWDCRRLFDDYKSMETFMHEKALLFMDEGYIFGDEGRGFERINLACPTVMLEAALDRLSKALKAR